MPELSGALDLAPLARFPIVRLMVNNDLQAGTWRSLAAFRICATLMTIERNGKKYKTPEFWSVYDPEKVQ